MIETVLIVEDTSSITETVTLALERRWPGVTIVSTPLGTEGLKLCRVQEFDAVILDLGLPDIDGYEVLDEIRSIARVPVLALTARCEDSDRMPGMECESYAYLAKPFKNLELLDRLSSLVDRTQRSADT